MEITKMITIFIQETNFIDKRFTDKTWLNDPY